MRWRSMATACDGRRARRARRPTQALAALVLRRRQLAQLVQSERNRARRVEEPVVLASIEGLLGWFEAPHHPQQSNLVPTR
jgi:transposase